MFICYSIVGGRFMNKDSKLIILVVIFVCSIFLITGCDNKKQEKNSKTVFEVEQVNDKNIKINLENIKKGEEKVAKLVVEDGETIHVDYKIKDLGGVNIYYFKTGIKHDKNHSDYEYINGEGSSQMEDFPVGEYDVVIEGVEKTTTGTIEIVTK